MNDEPIYSTFRRDPRPVARVWFIAPAPLPDRALEALSQTERQRAARFTIPTARDAFVRTRLALRALLGGAAETGELLTLTPRGKPLLPEETGLHLSITHTGPLAAVALAPVPIGIDIEHVRLPRHYDRVCARILHPATVAILDRADPRRRADLFTAAWTQREAHVKALGGGLFRTPDTLPFDPADGADGALRSIVDSRDDTTWTVRRFTPAPGTRGTLAAAGPLDSIEFLDWETPHE